MSRIAIIIVILILFMLPAAVQAVPSFPSSLYGTVKYNGENVPDGTLVEAYVNDKLCAQAYTRMYEGDSVYSLDVRGDDSDTAEVDGGVEGDTIIMKVGGVTADQTGIWTGGTNVQLDLTVSSSSILSGPQPTPTEIPTQTPLSYKSPIPTQAIEEVSTASISGETEIKTETGKSQITLVVVAVVLVTMLIALAIVGVLFFRNK